jgi:hypothetical protein
VGSRAAAKNTALTHPGPQQLLRRSWVSSGALKALTLASGVLMVHELSRSQLSALSVWPQWIWDLSLVPPDAGATIFIGLLTLIVVREQATASTRPLMTYSSMQGGANSSGLPSDDTGFWNVEIENVGAGAAIIRSVAYRLSRADSYSLDYSATVQQLKLLGLQIGRDYALYTFSAGGVIGPGAKTSVFEIGLKNISAIKDVDVQLEFETTLGDRYRKEVYCIPRVGMALHISPNFSILRLQ